MYIALLAVLLALAGALIVSGLRRRNPKQLIAGTFFFLLTALSFGLLSFLGEMLWFEELGQSQRFWTVVSAQAGFAAIAALVGGVGVFVLTLPIPAPSPLARIWPTVAGALTGGLFGFWNWQSVLKYVYRVRRRSVILFFNATPAFDNYLRLQGEGRFVEAAKELTRLQEALQQLARQLE